MLKDYKAEDESCMELNHPHIGKIFEVFDKTTGQEDVAMKKEDMISETLKTTKGWKKKCLHGWKNLPHGWKIPQGWRLWKKIRREVSQLMQGNIGL